MSYPRERERFFAALVQRLPLSTAELALSTLSRYAATIDRLAVAACNGDWPADNGQRHVESCPVCGSGWVPSQYAIGTNPLGQRERACKDCRTEWSVRRFVTAHLPGWQVQTQGDPRGYTLKLTAPDGAEFGVPTRQR